MQDDRFAETRLPINIDRQYTSLRRDGLIARLSTFQKLPHCALYNFLLQVDVVWLKAFFNKSLQLPHIHVIYPMVSDWDTFGEGGIRRVGSSSGSLGRCFLDFLLCLARRTVRGMFVLESRVLSADRRRRSLCL